MTVKITSGNIFNSKAQTLVNTVNCVGVMGKGVALQFKKLFPEMYQDYVNKCKHKEVKLTRPYLYKQILSPWILNFPTKDNWRSVSRISDIIAGLKYLELHYKEWGITSLAVPPLGCGHGGLDWKIVAPVLYEHLSQLNIPVELYAPHETPEHLLSPASELTEPEYANHNKTLSSKADSIPIKPAWLALVEVVDRVLREKYHWPIGRTIFQKLAYFATIKGLPTELNFVKGNYGPYCEQLNSLSTKLVNNGLIKEKELGKMISIEPGPTFYESRKKYGEEIKQWNDILNKVTDLILRMKTTNAETAATVTFAARMLAESTEKIPNNQEVFAAVRRWKPESKYKNITDEAINEAIVNLYLLDWIDVDVDESLMDEILVF